MRFVAAFLLLASLVIHLLLGVTNLFSSKYQVMKAETEAGDLSSVAADLDVSKEELDRMHAAVKDRTAGAGRRELLLGIGLLASALGQLVALALLLWRRGQRLAVTLTGAGLLGMMVVTALEHFMPLGLLTVVLLALALGSALAARRTPRAGPA